MGNGTVILMSLVIFCLAVSLVGLTVYLAHLTNLRWMRLFSEKLQIPAISMEDRPIVPEMKMAPEPKEKRRISIPIPLGGVPRKVD